MNTIRKMVGLAKPVIERFPTVAKAYRCVRDNWQTTATGVRTPMGFTLAGNRSMQKGDYEPEQTKIVKRMLEYVDVFIDVGANVGYYCCIALSKGKYVVAFEPIGRNLRFLLQNVKENNWESQIEVFPIALGNEVGVVKMYGGGTGASLVEGWGGVRGQYSALVPCSTLDKVLGKRFADQRCFVLVDVEGAELAVLQGASSFVKRLPKPIWMVEVCVSQNQPAGIDINPWLLQTFDAFFKGGYQAWTADEEPRLVPRDEVESIAMTGDDTVNTPNFLFVEKGGMERFG